MRQVRSFDVFDTVLTRTVGDPNAVIDVLARRLDAQKAIPVQPPVFAAARKRYERRLNRFNRSHVPLRDIYEHVRAALGAPDEAVEVWALAEEDLERDLTVAVPGARAMLEAARAEGHLVIFVSDTPHSEPLIHELLVAAGLARPEDRVFTSSARGATKSQGGLFDVVASELGPGFTYRHHGDHVRSDLAAPRIEGWASRHLPQAALTRYESMIEKHSTDTGGASSWIAGASRLARLEAYERGAARPVADVASGVMAPMLIGYALWVMGQARARGLRRLYFVARDGEVMLRVARPLFAALAPDIELRYLYGSRQPWVFGACATSDPMLSLWAAGRADFTARTALARVGLSPQEAHDALGLDLTRPERADLPLAAQERTLLAECLQRDPLRSRVRATAQAQADRCLAYFDQEGLLDGTPAALVDAGWSGRAAAALDHLLGSVGASGVPHFFVGFLGSPSETELVRDTDISPWLFDKQRQPGSVLGLHAPNVLVEMLCAGRTGRTIDYEVDGHAESVRPVLDREANDPVLAWGVDEMQRVAERAAELVAPRLSPEAAHLDSTPYVWDVLNAFWTHPTKAEVQAWGTFPGEEEIWPPFMPLAQRITGTDMVRRALRGERSMRPNNTWRRGSAMASRQPWRGLLQLRDWRDENDARLRRIPRRMRMEVAIRRKG